MIRDPASDRSSVVSNCTVEGARLFTSCSDFSGTDSATFLISGNSVISWVSSGVFCVFLISFCCAAGWWSPVALIKF